jgi:hypothetical protein
MLKLCRINVKIYVGLMLKLFKIMLKLCRINVKIMQD